MNLLLLEDRSFLDDRRVRLTGESAERLRRPRRLVRGDRLLVGKVDGRLGDGEIVDLGKDHIELRVSLELDPPPPLQLTLVLALPRPPALRRILQAVAAMGVKRICLIQTARTEKSYWQSSSLHPDALRRQLILGLEQARDTALPVVEQRRRFRPFAEDELPGWLAQGTGVLAHPGAADGCPKDPNPPVTLIVGPEGGWVPFELDRLQRAGARLTALGERALRVETAVVALVALLSQR